MPREANAVDFWRGIALITIFINHVPGIYYARFTHANYSFSDSADLFVFLAGWSLRYIVGSPQPTATRDLVSGVAARRPRGGTLRRADPDHDDRDRHAGGDRDHPRQPAAARMAQRGGGVLRSDPDPYRARHPHPPPRLFRHPAALRGADGDGADLRNHRPLRAQLAAAGFVRDLSRRADRAAAGSDLAGRRAMVLQPARVAAGVRARLRAWRARTASADLCAATSCRSAGCRCRSSQSARILYGSGCGRIRP